MFYRRRPLPLLVLAPAALWLVLSVTMFKDGGLGATNASIRSVLVAMFNSLSAYEFWRSRKTEDLPSCRLLFWVFVAYCLFNIARVPVTSIVPMPLGAAPAETWAIVVYNLASVVLALFVCVFMIVLSRERISAQNYSLALHDAMTEVYNRRAYHEYVLAFGRRRQRFDSALRAIGLRHRPLQVDQ